MNLPTLWRNRNTAQIVLIFLILVGVSLALWIEHNRAASEHRAAQLEAIVGRLRTSLIQTTSSLRGQLLDPTGNLDRKTSRETEATPAPVDLADAAAELERAFGQQDQIRTSVRDLMDHHRTAMNTFIRATLSQLATNPPAAIAYYNENYPILRDQRDKHLTRLLDQVQTFNNRESVRAQTLSTIGLGLVALISLAVIFVGYAQSASVSQPLAQLMAALERMRRGDFSQRLQLDRQDEFGILGEHLNRLANDLSGLVGQVQRSGIQVNTTATEIAATAREQQSTANQIAA
jgi:methyl-accepting chemotaxis protein WspA